MKMTSRVTAYRSAKEAKSDCESSSNDSSDGELPSSDTDNDEVFSVNKRRKVELPSTTTILPVAAPAPVKRKLNLWSQVLHDQNSDEISTNLLNSTVAGKAIARGPECYSRPRFQRSHKVSENDSQPAPIDKTIDTIVKGKIENFTIDKPTVVVGDAPAETNISPRKRKSRKRNRGKNGGGNNFRDASQEKKPVERFRGNNTNVPIYPMGKKVFLKKKRELTPDLSAEDVAFEIAYRLWEQKRHLVVKMVKFMGIEKAIFLCGKTELIESNGGMKTHKGNRRRTPGGVFIRLAQMDADVNQEGFQKILDADNAMVLGGVKRKAKAHKKNRTEDVHVTAAPPINDVTDDSGVVPSSSSTTSSTSATAATNDVQHNTPEVATMEVDLSVNSCVDSTSPLTSSTTVVSSTNILLNAPTPVVNGVAVETGH